MKLWFRRGGRASKKAREFIAGISRENIRKITVIRHAALGDMVLTRCFLVELREAFPDAFITLSISSNYTRGVPEDLVDRVHIVHGSDQRNVSFSERKKRFMEIGPQDIIFDLAATNRSFMTCFFNNAQLKIGYPYRSIHSRLLYDLSVCRSDLHFEVDDMLSMLHAIGIQTTHPHRYNMPGEALSRSRPYIVYFAGASVPEKCWPIENYNSLINTMAGRYPNHDHLLLEGIMEWEKANTILGETGKGNIAAIDADNIDDTVALLKGASLVVANDTGIRNLAIVCETPTVGIFINTVPFRYWPRQGKHALVLPENTAQPSLDVALEACSGVLGGDSPAA